MQVVLVYPLAVDTLGSRHPLLRIVRFHPFRVRLPFQRIVGVFHIFRGSNPFEIHHAVVVTDSVLMVDVWFAVRIQDERLGYYDMCHKSY